MELIRALAADGRADEAHVVWHRLAGRAAGSAAVWAELARLAEAQARATDALACWRAAIALRPHWRWAERSMARLLASLHRFAEAEALADQGCREAPADPEAWRLAAELASRQEAPARSVPHLERALVLARDAPEIRRELAAAHVALHRFSLAERLLADRLVAQPEDALAWRHYAESAELRGDLALAGERWAAAARAMPDSAEPGLGLVRAAERSGRYALAERTARELAATHPDDLRVLEQLARLLLVQARREEAQVWVERALSLRPDQPSVRLLQVRLLAESGRIRAARKEAEALATRFPERPDALAQRAIVAQMAGPRRMAEAVLVELIAAFPRSHALALRLADQRERHGETARARTDVEDALARGQGALPLRLRAVDLAFALNDRRGALAHLEPLADEYPQRRDVLKRLARAEVVAGRIEVARRLWAGCTNAEPAAGPVRMLRLDTRPIPDDGREIRLFAKLRNEAPRLPWWLDFHRRQGVDRFILADNGSDDGSRDYLLSREDVHLYVTTDAFDASGGGTGWYNHLLERHGHGHWCLTVDADEVLAYPGAERLSLRGLVAWLDRQGAEAISAFMLDLYPDQPVTDLDVPPGVNPLPICRFFDRDGYVILDRPDFPFRTVWGGLAARVLHRRRQLGPMLQKVPLVRWAPGMRYLSNAHLLHPVRLAEESGVLLHLKYLNRFGERVRAEADRRQYWAGGRVYAELARCVVQAGAGSFVHAGSAEFDGTARLVELGLMRSTPAFDAYLEAQGSVALPDWPSRPPA